MSNASPTEIAFQLGAMRRVPEVETIMRRWQVTRATAYRWRRFVLAGGRSQFAPRARDERGRWVQP